jgi:4-aminobutyrate--pyruvate transaminase
MQFSRLVKYAASAGSLQGTHNFAEAPARYYSSEPSLQETEETGCVKFPTAKL